jgi:fido (protein-threonine AMPylation protein)
VSDIFAQPDDAATPLTEEEKRDLKLSYIANRSELNAAEQENIARGQDWALNRRRNILTESFIKALHRHMLNDVWR